MTITRAIAYCLCLLILMAAAPGAYARQTVHKQIELAQRGPTILRGTVAPGAEDSWSFTIPRGKEARVMILRGEHLVIFDVYDSDELAANEGGERGGLVPRQPRSLQRQRDQRHGPGKEEPGPPAALRDPHRDTVGTGMIRR